MTLVDATTPADPSTLAAIAALERQERALSAVLGRLSDLRMALPGLASGTAWRGPVQVVYDLAVLETRALANSAVVTVDSARRNSAAAALDLSGRAG